MMARLLLIQSLEDGEFIGRNEVFNYVFQNHINYQNKEKIIKYAAKEALHLLEYKGIKRFLVEEYLPK